MVRSVADEDKTLMPLHFVLAKIGSELQGLNKIVDQIQSTLSPVLNGLHLDKKSHRDIQSLDILSQKLSSLSLYTINLSQLIPEDFQVDADNALSSISISALKHRLKGGSASHMSENLSGDLEIF